MSGGRFAVIRIESLVWSPRSDIIAAGRFVVSDVGGQRITTIDAYLLTSGRVEMWEDDDTPSVDAGGSYSGSPHDDWRGYVEPLLANALGAKNPRKLS